MAALSVGYLLPNALAMPPPRANGRPPGSGTPGPKHGNASAGAGAKRGKAGTKLAGDAEAGFGLYGAVSAAATDPAKFISSAARWFQTADETDPARAIAWCCEDFKPRKIKAPIVLAWLVMQLLGLVYQLVLLQELTRHLGEYEETLAQYCGPEHRQQGICLGPAWNLSFSNVLTFPATSGYDSQEEFDFVVPSDTNFNFDTKSNPPTFLVGVEPQVPYASASWKITFRARDGPSWSSGELPPLSGSGNRYRVVTSRWSSSRAWTGSLSLKSKYPEMCKIHLYVVDSNIKHLEDVHSQKQCSFEDSWTNFNERHSGEHHRILTWAWRATAAFAVVSVLSVSAVLYQFFFYVEGGKLLSRVVGLKFFFQDFPQQMCIVAYLYGWYASNGLRCQMCLFHPQHCDDQRPLHWTNLLVCIFTLLSASSNQLLVQAKLRQYDEEEECCLWLMRAAMFSVSSLPFTTALFILASTLLNTHSPFVYIITGVPSLLGWGLCCCVPFVMLCDEDGDW